MMLDDFINKNELILDKNRAEEGDKIKEEDKIEDDNL
jgi:hypothetical protein